MAEILVLGAGMVGVCTALALQARGHQVVVLDRHGVGEETSYGNAGIIQVEAAEPYALPQDIKVLARYLTGRSNDVTWSPSGLLSMLPALWRYAYFSRPKRHAQISQIYSQLTARASKDHDPLIQAASADALIQRDGFQFLYRQPQTFAAAAQMAERLKREYGVSSLIQDGATFRQSEPALTATPAGAILWEQSWRCRHPGELVKAYARLFQQRGGVIANGDATKLTVAKGWQLPSDQGILSAEHAVVALGPWSPAMLVHFGYRIPMIYKRGYHTHFQAPLAPQKPFLDVDNGVLAAPMQQGVRVTSGAALVKHNAPAKPVQLERGILALRSILDLGQRNNEDLWFGTRPCLPDMLPLVGPSPKHKGLWFHFGHGHQGFTLGPTTAELLCQSIDGQSNALLDVLSPGARL